MLNFFFSEQLKTQLCQKQELLEQEQNAEKETIAEDDVDDTEESSGFIQTFENRLNIMQEEHDVYVDKCKLCSTQ